MRACVPCAAFRVSLRVFRIAGLAASRVPGRVLAPHVTGDARSGRRVGGRSARTGEPRGSQRRRRQQHGARVEAAGAADVRRRVMASAP